MVSVDVQAAAGVATVIAVARPDGGHLALERGREVVARVVASGANGDARISLAGQVLEVRADAALRVGDEIRLSVTRADAAGVRLSIIPRDAMPTPQQTTPDSMRGLVDELAKAGVPITPRLAQAVGNLAEQLGGGSGAARAVAALAGRDLALAPAAAGRVAAALDLAGSLGPSLASLAARSPEIAAALPAGPPSAAALRSLLAPGLADGELAVARIVQALQAGAPGGPVNLPSPGGSSVAVIQNYVASQVAANASLDSLAAQNSLAGMADLLAARGQSGATAPTGLAPAALQSALRGQAVGGAAMSPAALDVPGAATAASSTAAAPATAAQAAQMAADSAARRGANASAATGAGAAIPSPTNARAAQAVADLAMLATRFAPAVTAGAGGVGLAEAGATRGMNAGDVAQRAGRDGAVGAATASGFGAGAAGDPAPLVAAIRAFLASAGTEQDSAQLLRTLTGSNPEALAAAIRSLPESQSLQLAGRMLELLGDGADMPAGRLHDLRHGVHASLDNLGRALQQPAGAGDELAALRSALEHVAANDPRPAVAQDAARLLAAADGQQILSRTASGSDPGYVYFQVPMPDGRGAEVMVRREPGRREVSFDEFNIAFLLDTEQIGTLMIQLDAHPAGIRADVRTDIPALEPFLRERTEALIEPLGHASGRPVIVTSGVFDQDPPSSLLDQHIGPLHAGVNEFYA